MGEKTIAGAIAEAHANAQAAGYPETDEEWRQVAMLAAGCRLIEDARLYGFILGGPIVDVDRVDEFLLEAAGRGIVPTSEEAQQAAFALIAEVQDA